MWHKYVHVLNMCIHAYVHEIHTYTWIMHHMVHTKCLYRDHDRDRDRDRDLNYIIWQQDDLLEQSTREWCKKRRFFKKKNAWPLWHTLAQSVAVTLPSIISKGLVYADTVTHSLWPWRFRVSCWKDSFWADTATTFMWPFISHGHDYRKFILATSPGPVFY